MSLTIKPNSCYCHPETCSCNPWAVYKEKVKIETFYDKADAEIYVLQQEICEQQSMIISLQAKILKREKERGMDKLSPEHIKNLIARLNTQDKAIRFLQEAGLLDEKGELAPPYRPV